MSIVENPTAAPHQHRVRAWHEPKRRVVHYECSGCGLSEKATYPRATTRDELLRETADYVHRQYGGGSINRGTFPEYPAELPGPEEVNANGEPHSAIDKLITPDSDLLDLPFFKINTPAPMRLAATIPITIAPKKSLPPKPDLTLMTVEQARHYVMHWMPCMMEQMPSVSPHSRAGATAGMRVGLGDELQWGLYGPLPDGGDLLMPIIGIDQEG